MIGMLSTGERHAALRPESSILRPAPTLLFLVLLLLPLPSWLFPGPAEAAQVLRECVFWCMTLALIGWVVVVERRPLRSIGLRGPGWKGFASAAAASAVMIGGITFIYVVVFPAIGETQSGAMLHSVRALLFALRAAITLRAATFEELLYRGFAIERLTELTGLRWIAALLSLLAFTLAHLDGWGVGHLLIAAFGGAVLTALYLWRRDLVANGLAHLLTDGVGLMLG